MLKEWKEICGGSYSFSVDNKFAGKMDISLDSSAKTAKSYIGENVFTFNYVGFWKTLIEISDINGMLLAKAFYEKWYSDNLILDYREKRYKIIKRKNSPDNWEIIEEKKNYSSFDQNSNIGSTVVKVTSINDSSDLLINFLLWYLSVIEEPKDYSNDIITMDMIV